MEKLHILLILSTIILLAEILVNGILLYYAIEMESEYYVIVNALIYIILPTVSLSLNFYVCVKEIANNYIYYTYILLHFYTVVFLAIDVIQVGYQKIFDEVAQFNILKDIVFSIVYVVYIVIYFTTLNLSNKVHPKDIESKW